MSSTDLILWRRDRAGERLGDGVFRFRDPSARTPLPPFPGYEREPEVLGPASGARVRPAFATKGRRSLVKVDLGPRVSFYGTGEQSGPLLRNGRRKVLWNSDSFDYTEKTPSLYQSHPFVLSLREDGSAVGVLIETTWRCEISLKGRLEAAVHGPAPAVTIIERSSAREVLLALSGLIGRPPLPPRWALGYHQCRWSYEPESRVREIAEEFRERKIPCDVLWLDIDYMDGFRCFTFDAEKFPDPAAMNSDLRAMGFRTVYMIDPGIKADPDYGVYREMRDRGLSITRADGTEYQGEVWPGACAFPDFTRADVREWWAGLYGEFLKAGMDGVWNDMNEPAVFNVPTKTMPESNLHRADESLGGPGPHAQFHNVYGMLMARATREGIHAARPEKRPFVLTRAGFLGSHRYAATWTGDNKADWHHLRWSIPMALNLGLCGQPLAGPDIGGFIGDSTPGLFARWMGIGALLPFARGHKNKPTKDHEPWSLGEECEKICRLALQRRYRLIPYLYTLMYEAHMTGLPVARPLFMADETDARLRCVDDAFLLGDGLLVRANVDAGHDPLASKPAPSGAPLPRGLWRAFDVIDEPHPELPHLFLKGGCILPLGPAMQHTDEKPLDPLTLIVSLDDRGNAEGTLYEDAGDGWGYERGDYRLTRFEARRENGTVVVREAGVRGSFTVPPGRVEVHVLGEASSRFIPRS